MVNGVWGSDIKQCAKQGIFKIEGRKRGKGYKRVFKAKNPGKRDL